MTTSVGLKMIKEERCALRSGVPNVTSCKNEQERMSFWLVIQGEIIKFAFNKVIILETSKADFVDIAVFYYKQAKCTLSSLWTWQILIMIMRSIQHFFDSQEQLIGITTLGLWFFFFFFGTRNTIPPRRRIYTDTHFCCFGNDWPKAMQANSPARPAGRFMAPSPSLSLIS